MLARDASGNWRDWKLDDVIGELKKVSTNKAIEAKLLPGVQVDGGGEVLCGHLHSITA